ncbi:MAG: 1-acyl-sn-glycerol-3-phosphate acyltransferase [Actinomycetota bacterium]
MMRSRCANATRRMLQFFVLIPIVRWFCHPLTVRGRCRLPAGAAIYIANHASHADTAALIAALPRRIRRRFAPAAAQAYFFATRGTGAATSLLTGAFPFPRSGNEGLNRAKDLLDRGTSVLLFPEGTRSRNGGMASFKCGVGKLAAYGYPVVPVGIAGTSDVLAPGTTLPRRGSVAIAFGDAIHFSHDDRPDAIASQLGQGVAKLRDGAFKARGPRRRSAREVARDVASSRACLILAFSWGVAEAVAFPVVPDFAVALLALAVPRRFWKLALAAVCGSVAGGVIASDLGSIFGVAPVAHLPLVTPRMSAAAAGWLNQSHGWALWHQVAFGVPYKAFAWQASARGTGVVSLAAATFLVRGLRMLAVGALLALLGRVLRRVLPRIYGAFVIVFSIGFAIGLAHVVTRWS